MGRNLSLVRSQDSWVSPCPGPPPVSKIVTTSLSTLPTVFTVYVTRS